MPARTQSLRTLIATSTWAALLILLLPLGVSAQTELQVFEPIVPTTTAALRDQPPSPAFKFGDPIVEVPKRVYPRQGGGPAPGPVVLPGPPPSDRQSESDRARLREGQRISTPVLNFAGQGFSAVNPPDTVGDVGPDHYVQMINDVGGSNVSVWDKAGNLLFGPVNLDSIGIGACATGRGDPIVLYDRFADRWLLTEFASVSNRLCVYVSTTPDPGGSYYDYQFPTPFFPDYPKYGVWPDAYYLSSNEPSPAVYALERSDMLLGLPAQWQRFTAPSLAGFGFQALIPSDLDGPVPPPTGAPNYFMRHRDDEVHNVGSNDPSQDFLEIWEFSVDFAVPANSTFTNTANIGVAEFDSDLCGLVSFSCFPQPAPGPALDPLREVIMWRLQYRNDTGTQTLVGNFVTDVDGTDRGGIRWFELNNTGAGWSLAQEGTYSPDTNDRWMGSIAMDQERNIAVGYSEVSPSLFAQMSYAGRFAFDVPGTLPRGENLIIAGTGASGSNRWGDYSAMSVDPADDCTFWHTNMYATAGAWATQITTFKFSSCAPPLEHSCCEEGGPGCDNTAVQNAVCAIDSYCCATSWDGLCVSEVDQFANDTGANCGCCFSSPETGCWDAKAPLGDFSVRDCVCAADPFCCSTRWDGVCVDEVEALGCGICEDAYGMVVDDATGTVTVFDARVDNNIPGSFGDQLDRAIGDISIAPVGIAGDCSIASPRRGFATDFQFQVPVVNPVEAYLGAPGASVTTVPISNIGEDTSVTPDGQFVVVCDGSGPEPVSVVSNATLTEVSTFATGENCNSVEVCQDGSVLVTSTFAQGTNNVRRLTIDAAGNLTDTGDVLPLADEPNNVVCSPDSGSGIVITRDTDQIVSFTIPGLSPVSTTNLSGTFGIALAIDTSRGRVYTRDNDGLNPRNGFLEAFSFDTSTGILGATPLWSVGIADTRTLFGIDQIALNLDKSKLYVSQPGAVQIHAPQTGAVIGTVTSPDIIDPLGVCFLPEPGVMLQLASGMVLLGGLTWRRQRGATGGRDL